MSALYRQASLEEPGGNDACKTSYLDKESLFIDRDHPQQSGAGRKLRKGGTEGAAGGAWLSI